MAPAHFAEADPNYVASDPHSVWGRLRQAVPLQATLLRSTSGRCGRLSGSSGGGRGKGSDASPFAAPNSEAKQLPRAYRLTPHPSASSYLLAATYLALESNGSREASRCGHAGSAVLSTPARGVDASSWSSRPRVSMAVDPAASHGYGGWGDPVAGTWGGQGAAGEQRQRVTAPSRASLGLGRPFGTVFGRSPSGAQAAARSWACTPPRPVFTIERGAIKRPFAEVAEGHRRRAGERAVKRVGGPTSL
jgi:hypothetical protein